MGMLKDGFFAYEGLKATSYFTNPNSKRSTLGDAINGFRAVNAANHFMHCDDEPTYYSEPEPQVYVEPQRSPAPKVQKPVNDASKFEYTEGTRWMWDVTNGNPIIQFRKDSYSSITGKGCRYDFLSSNVRLHAIPLFHKISFNGYESEIGEAVENLYQIQGQAEDLASQCYRFISEYKYGHLNVSYGLTVEEAWNILKGKLDVAEEKLTEAAQHLINDFSTEQKIAFASNAYTYLKAQWASK